MSEKNSVLFLGRQPIVNKDTELIGYELLYRNESGTSEMQNEQSATANVLTHTLSLSGIDAVVGNHLAFVNVDAKFLHHDMILSTPADRFVFELDITKSQDEKYFSRLEELYMKGYCFAFCINDVSDETVAYAKKVEKYIQYIKLNTMQVDKEKLFKILLSLGSSQKTLIATHVETKELYESFYDMGFELFQGYFFAKPEMVSSSQVTSDAGMIISLCNLLTTDSSVEDIVEGFSAVPTISMQLIQYLNSCTFNFKDSIDSIGRMVTLIGRTPLQQWLFLTLYASTNENKENNALLETVQQRTQLVVDLLKVVKPDVSKDELSQAYFVGLLSLMHIIVKQPLEAFLNAIHINPVIKEALLEKRGLLGEIYEVCIAIEQFDLAKTEAFMLEYDIAPSNFQKFLFRSFESANTFKIES